MGRRQKRAEEMQVATAAASGERPEDAPLGDAQIAALGLRCAVCLDVVRAPRLLRPCAHRFCGECTAGAERCPLCRQLVEAREGEPLLEARMARLKAACEDCDAVVPLCEIGAHRAACAAARAAEKARAAAAAQRASPAAAATPNRSTFACPVPGCGQTGRLDHHGLIEHLDAAHKNARCAAVCPVCASMPWGDPTYVSKDVVGHIKMRHRFEYGEYVDYAVGDEDAVLQSVLARSMQDN